ncbi:MAG TPA: hypothetical protein VGV37_26005 [Aliidongia sp.]|uniref:hypothetical protein n=1 Tax=Aliidongia sp. TaxID=1914230 RepID=UPI002DDD7B7F|nr:hypothetical protein [Aliidongia sp.]HEV2678012.1 hypothetical protein [Aliidongia sp.]
MFNVGFYGGSEIRELGPASDMQVFFGCTRLAASYATPDEDYSLLTDRLYRRYLRLNELNPATDLVSKARKVLNTMPADRVDWPKLGWDPLSTRLNISSGSVGDVLVRYLDGARDLISNARGFEKRFHSYKPVITIVTDTPRFYIEKSRPLADYDALEGEPVWLRS